MTDGEEELLKELLADLTLSNGWIADLLSGEGYPVDRAAVGHFRRKLRSGKATL
jgi:hypothetical protein